MGQSSPYLALRLPTTTSRQVARRVRGRLAHLLRDIEPYYDKVDLYLGISGVKENLPHLPDSQFQRPSKLNLGEVKLRESLKKVGQVLTPYRAGVTTTA